MPDRVAQVDAVTELFGFRRSVTEHRAALAADTARLMVDALIAGAPGLSDDGLEDDFCIRYGAAMGQFDGGRLEDLVNPEDLAGALLSAIDERLHEAVESGADVAVLQRLLTVVAGVVPPPLCAFARDLVAGHVDGRAAGKVARGRALTGEVLWGHDAYGSRWAVVAPFASVGGRDRWYLWDVDTCGYEIATVYSGFYPSAESALAAWSESVGHAAAEATLTAVDDAETLGALLGGEVEQFRIGGESQEQYSEFLRSRRLGRAAREAARGVRGRACGGLTVQEASEGFAQRLRRIGYHDRPAGDGSGEGPAGADDLAAELADSWFQRDHPRLYPLCSPHKVAATVLHLCDYYQDDFAAELVAVLPEWIRFLAEQTGMAEELTDRCLAYASGELKFPGNLDDRERPNLMARVAE
ncbi:hypothetical protein QTQ03_05250 [Micromonospora sp. WMMA1363]|uniref:hypothetical protein n=1 Tax=Micromonospora sp. WMMA1363 TaxID=3053985 RepID=UPI00259D1FA0|nr:hypothetical protein [Micromonospora sp. WMMA1363]MDM4719031.1 hypothetical protein [Micromonospora sp. WMMA1363]